ncbi:MAG: hypothetical protein PUC26_04585 [Eubacteriales bacterium]|jgi:hypothetical protein|nr:hypothetical protein [Eubacteriales bacterium]
MKIPRLQTMRQAARFGAEGLGRLTAGLLDHRRTLLHKVMPVYYDDDRLMLYAMRGRRGQRHKEGPYCTYCWEKEGDLISLHIQPDGSYQCPGCKNVVRRLQTKSKTEEDPAEQEKRKGTL